MSLNQDKDKIVKYIRKSLILQDAGVGSDPAFDYTDDDIFDIVEMSVFEYNPEYDLENFPKQEYPFIVSLSRREIFWRLATSTAPLYPLSAEGASLRKDYRFDHYLALIKQLDSEYSTKLEQFRLNNPNSVKVGNILVDSKHYSTKQMLIQEEPKVNLTIVTEGEDYIDIKWDKFKVSGGMFRSYEIYLAKDWIYNEFEGIKHSYRIKEILNPLNVTARLTGLEKDTEYHLAVRSVDTNGIFGIDEITFTLTNPEEVEPDVTE